MHEALTRMSLPERLLAVLENAPNVAVPETRSELLDLAMGGQEEGLFEVAFEVPDRGRVVEATVARCRNGVVVNYPDPYMRRREPDCMAIADEGATDKPRYRDLYGAEFGPLRERTFGWLEGERLIALPFMAGGPQYGYPALLVAPENAGFFAGGLADLQGFIPASQVPQGFTPRAAIFLAPTFRHTDFEGKQMVVHNRGDEMYEMFSYNLYPGPSAKKGVYGLLIEMGEREGWVTAHASAVKMVTPYDNTLAIMHEGASGGGKSEMTEEIHRELDGRILLSRNIVSEERNYIKLSETCDLHPVADDMALCHPRIQNASRKLVVTDAEGGWFLRTNQIKRYGTDPHLESMTIHPQEPLIFLNYDTVPGSTCLLWEHIMDAPGKPCPNPRVIMPRRFVPRAVPDPVEIDIRSFGFRTPPCTREAPGYGILGLFHVLPPALAWLWRLVAPRGYKNPSVTGGGDRMSSEGVGSYWPFATGRRIAQANLLLEQIRATPNTRYILVPNQH
ncbi:MAG TPA: DUF4914 family protein, partial [Candidatus Limnocylindria bacterium]|nr:DUF4914 family protein [Candidatus Limnocylindria bacterium]